MRTVLYFSILLGLLSLLVTASYTWISLSRHLGVSDLAMYVNSGASLRLAARYDAPEEEWGRTLDFQTIVGGDTMLTPATWSERQQGLFAALYGYDGRTVGGGYVPLTEEANANRNDGDAFFVTGTFYIRATDACGVVLGEGVAVNGGENGSGTYVIGTPVWNQQRIEHEGGGSGAECAVRVRLEITPVDPNTGRPNGEPQAYIYEPNCDVHIDGQTNGYVETPSMDGTDTLTDPSRIILQSASSWTEAYPVQENVTIKEFGKFLTDTELFELEENGMARIRLTVWLEGMDVDCTNDIRDAQITMNVQFSTDAEQGHGGLVTIPD